MGKLSVWHGILVACLLSAVSVPLMRGLQWLGGSGAVFIVVLALTYLAYLLASSPSRRGRFVLGLGSAVILLGTGIANPVSVMVGALAVGLIWLVRSVLFYHGILPALWDGGLCTLSAVCALGTAVSTHRLWLAVWVFFLLQALFIYIPQRSARVQDGQGRGRRQSASRRQEDAFARAHRAASEALQAMAQRL
jgi:hypothetical protein